VKLETIMNFTIYFMEDLFQVFNQDNQYVADFDQLETAREYAYYSNDFPAFDW